jgi:hypothetical protein
VNLRVIFILSSRWGIQKIILLLLLLLLILWNNLSISETLLLLIGHKNDILLGGGLLYRIREWVSISRKIINLIRRNRWFRGRSNNNIFRRSNLRIIRREINSSGLLSNSLRELLLIKKLCFNISLRRKISILSYIKSIDNRSQVSDRRKRPIRWSNNLLQVTIFLKAIITFLKSLLIIRAIIIRGF